MKRLVVAAALLLSTGLAAHADVKHWTDLTHQSRSDDVLNADADYCNWKVGRRDVSGVPVTPAYRSCMRGRGWRYDYTEAHRHHHHGWIDPDTGLRCHSILGGFGSICSN